jgi:ubiquinone biosynthesis monooxygenase Coq6
MKNISKMKFNVSYNYIKNSFLNFKFNSFSNKSEINYQDTDIVIVGGGVTGLSLAAGLMKSNYFNKSANKITIIDHPPKIKPENFIYKAGRLPDPRVISLTPASIKFFRSIGLWEKLDERLIKYINSMQIWENKGSSYINMNSKDSESVRSFLDTISLNRTLFNVPYIDTEYICATIEINHLLSGFNKLLTELNTNNQIQFIDQILEYDNLEIENSEDYAYLKIDKKDINLRTKLLIASDGAKSIIRSKLNIPTYGYEYNETGLVATLRCNKATDTAYQRFLHNGIFALLPLYGDLYSIVLSMPKTINENLISLDEQIFIDVLNRILHNPSEMDLFSNKLDRLIPLNNNFSSPPVVTNLLSKRFEFNLQLQYAQESLNKNTILIGDASHSIHPLAGQGLNLGISDSAILSNELVLAINEGRRLNDKRTLDSYALKSGLNTKIMIGTVEAIKNSYLPTNLPFSELRNLGMTLCNKSNLIKGLIMQVASGKVFNPTTYAWDKQ